ncbi:RsmD family RNA methyltransferase [Salinimicrobium terrae]|uniref:RsmD family RNA methyltransferase n=1 Tax=Salinimicrobium terrae TaxID=470866 RepID=UPI0003F50674|nr:RsmD family RNA methyltransferase [Salinimicrobium terrae]
MRIVSGIHKGKKIIAPKKLPVRPTTDFAKEALFNILNNQYHFSALKVVDLFSGTGNITYEFGSRGAAEIIAVDAHFECVKFINKKAEELDLPVRTVKSDVFKFLKATGETANIIFADPPYGFEVELLQQIVELTFSRNLLEEGGSLIIEHSKKIDLSHLDHFVEVRKYGNSVFSFFS